jgi:hypothetical protein
VTFGGQDLYDTMDLLSVFNLTRSQVTILSYEESPAISQEARRSPVFRALSRVPSINIQIISARFPSDVELIQKLRGDDPFIYFLDYTGTFGRADTRAVQLLLENQLIRQDDFVLITSSLTPRVVNQPRFMSRYTASFQLLFQNAHVDSSFKIRNHVDLLFALALSDFERTSQALGSRQRMRATLLKKYKYSDSSAMGLWLYALETGKPTNTILDCPFEEFPHAFSAPRRADIPNIFD